MSEDTERELDQLTRKKTQLVLHSWAEWAMELDEDEVQIAICGSGLARALADAARAVNVFRAIRGNWEAANGAIRKGR